MKNIFLLIIIFLTTELFAGGVLVIGSSGPAGSGYIPVNPALGSVNFNDADGLGSLRVVVGEAGACMLSQDDGATNIYLNVGTQSDLNCVAILSSNSFIVGGVDGIFKTIDGGNTFQQIVNNAVIYSIAYYANFVICGSSQGKYYMSINQGDNFVQNVETIIDITADILCIEAFANTYYAGTSNGKIYKSTNNGTNFVQQTSGTTNSINNIKFIDASTGLAACNGGIVDKTTDGGNNWTPIPTGSPGNLNCLTEACDFQTIIAAGDNGLIIRSTNHGTSWSPTVSPGNTRITSIQRFQTLSTLSFYAKGNDGIIWKSTDCGLTWINEASEITQEEFNDAILLSNLRFGGSLMSNSAIGDSILLTGKNGTIFRSLDHGLNYSQLNSGTTLDINKGFFLNSQTGWVGGGNNPSGLLLKTTNGGTNWVNQTPQASYVVNLIHFFDASTGFVLGPLVNFRKTTNGGTNWFTVASPFSTVIEQMKFVDANTGIGCGWSERIVRTTNAGTNWTQFSLGGLGNFHDITFLNTTTGFVAGDQCRIWRTSDAGTSWTVVNSEPASGFSFNSIRFLDDNTGYACGGKLFGTDEGGIYKTTNGGFNWTRQNSGTHHRLNNILPISPTEVLVIGAAGTILKTTNGGDLLPVELSSFTSSVNGRSVLLSWSTSSEINNSGFDIERADVSTTNNNWNKIGFVHGNGTSFITHNYSYNDRGLTSGKYNYRLKQKDYNGNLKYYELSSEVFIGISQIFRLTQNYPNPFNPVTKIKYDIPFNGRVLLKVFDILGREVRTLVNENQLAGYYTIHFNGSDLSSGTYFYRLNAQGENQFFSKTLKMVLSK
ncbi:hypothetical protein BH10BAC5_BH10BAC5_27900 [soil metagenome]